jgi:hypothetical protein
MPKPNCSQEQKDEIRKTLQSTEWIYEEKPWNYLIANILLNDDLDGNIVNQFINSPDTVRIETNVWFEAQPFTPYLNEGNTCVDIAFGSLIRRGVTISGIDYNPLDQHGLITFIEGKFFSDVSKDVSYDPFRNQIDRTIENLLVIQGGNHDLPKKLYFVLLTPKVFKENRLLRLYGYRMNEYGFDLAEMNSSAIYNSISNSRLIRRTNSPNWVYPNIRERLTHLKIKWLTYEQIIGPIFNRPNLDVTNIASDNDLISRLHQYIIRYC